MQNKKFIKPKLTKFDFGAQRHIIPVLKIITTFD
jgi:hypothetical protein